MGEVTIGESLRLGAGGDPGPRLRAQGCLKGGVTGTIIYCAACFGA
jgi:hypothetical protein